MTPNEWLARVTSGMPGAVWRKLDEMRAERGRKLPDWPDWCFMPFHGWYALVSMMLGKERLSVEDTALMQALAVAGTWRVTQDVVRFDATLYKALVDTPVTGNLPSAVLSRLPAWCVYVETPEMTAQGVSLAGIWAMLDHDATTGADELRLFLFDGQSFALIPVVLQLGDWTVGEAIEKIVYMDVLRELIEPDQAQAAVKVAKELSCVPQIVSLLLYLCTYGFPRSSAVQQAHPAYPKPKKVKDGWRLFPAQKPTVRVVGESIGRKLREAEKREADAPDRELGTHASPRPHIRRGHWHGFWHGPRDGDRQLKLRWLPPIPVAMGEDGDE